MVRVLHGGRFKGDTSSKTIKAISINFLSQYACPNIYSQILHLAHALLSFLVVGDFNIYMLLCDINLPAGAEAVYIYVTAVRGLY